LWEETSAEAEGYPFTVDFENPTMADAYNDEYKDCLCSESCSAGTLFEEERSRAVEKALDVNTINDYDWSFDPKNEIQGKKW